MRHCASLHKATILTSLVATVVILASTSAQASMTRSTVPLPPARPLVALNWAKLTPAGSTLSPMAYQASSYTGEADISFGGWNGWSYLDYTYAYTSPGGNTPTWTNLTGSVGTPPSARLGAAMAETYGTNYHAVLFGGESSSGLLGDTWVLYYHDYGGAAHADWYQLIQGTNLTCISLGGGSSCPAAREGAVLIDDAHAGYEVLFGGATNATNFLGDTWEFSYTTCTTRLTGLCGTWEEVCATSCGPTATGWMGGAFDPTSDEDVIFGGEQCASPCTSPNYVSYSCAFTGGATLGSGTWGSCGSLTGPNARVAWGQLGEDLYTSSDGAVLFGGLNGGGSLSNTALYASGTWTAENPATIPTARAYGAVVYDDFDSPTSVLMWGGYATSGGGGTYLSDTWLWN